MVDLADRAQIVEEQQRNAAVQARTVYVGEPVDDCVDCGDQIPSARQIALPGVQTCVHCAERSEVR